MMTKDEIIKILEEAIAFRERDVQERQIEIDNYALSLEVLDAKYSGNLDVTAYRPHLEELLRASIVEQAKVKIFLEATKVNLAKHKG